LRIQLPRYLIAIALSSLAACSFLPTSGPSKGDVQGVAGAGIVVVDVNEDVARRLLSAREHKLFSEQLPAGPEGDQIVEPGDIIEVSVWEAPPALLFTATTINVGTTLSPNAATLPQQMVDRDGTISVPFAGKVTVAGKTLRAIETDIMQLLKNKANQPQVLVRVSANNTAYVTVVGEVTTSTRFPLTPRGEHILDALAAASGVRQPIDKTTIQLTRGTSVYSLPLDTIIRDPRQNIVLQPGDVITALFQPFSFTALGATGKSDEITFEAKGITLAQALARAGGPLDNRSDAAGAFIFRLEERDALQWSTPPQTTPDGKVAVIYRIDLRDPRTFFVAQSFPMANKDVLYIANAPAAQLQKFLNLLVSTIYPIQGAVNLSK
jgi:polysaccharide export outer membrane protein